MKSWLLCTALALFCSARSAGIEATMSRSVFYQGESSAGMRAVLEVYWQVDPRGLHYFRTADSNVSARYRTDIRVLSDTGVVREDHYVIVTPPRAPQYAAVQSLLDIYRTPLPPGRYHVEVTLTEPDFAESSIVLRDSFNIETPVSTAFLSDVQLLDTFYNASVPDPFTKSGIRAVPLCVDFLDDHRDLLHHYVERYALDRVDQGRFPLRQRVYINRKAGDAPIVHLQRVDTIRSNTDATLPQSLPIATLASGNWLLNVLLEDKDGKAIASVRRAFQRLNTNPAEVPSSTPDTISTSGTYINLAKTFLSKYNAAQVRAMLKMVLPVADPSERVSIDLLLNQPDDMYSRYFLYNFFNRRNAIKPDEAWKTYSDKVREVNKLYGAGGRPGYETDRGYLHLKYGPPSERIPVRSESGALPYEVWVYEVLPRTARTSYFLFYQPPELIADYKLLHSTVPDEVRNPAWRSVLYPGGNSRGTAASRAEQYFGNR